MKKIAAWLLTVCLLLLAGCSGGAAKSADLAAVKDSLAAQFKLDEMMALSEDDLLDMYGIKGEDVKQYAALIARSSTSADEILLFEAKDGDAAKRLKEQLDKRYQAKLNEAKDYLPDEYAKIAACKVAQSGNYVSLIVSSDAEAMAKVYQDAFK
ncbi:MAG: DUF4358 domain-containing protein [Clostridia bacterium]|nr:DUF4358 domain-containing protein [Clostridia bacterium]